MVYESIGFQATAPGAAGAAAAAVSGDSLTVRLSTAQSPVRIVGWFADQQAAGFQQLIWPSGHDTTRGIRSVVNIGLTFDFLMRGLGLPIQAQEVVSALISGSATAGDIESGCLTLAYDGIPGIEGRYIDTGTLRQRMVKMTSVNATISTGTTGGWSGAEAINAESDLLKANTDYAILGGNTSVAACAIGIRAPDWGNLRIALPGGVTEVQDNAAYFVRRSEWLEQPAIPVFNSSNRSGVFIDALQDENGGDPIVNLFLAELSRGA